MTSFELSEKEVQDFIWKDGDQFVLRRGNLSISATTPHVMPSMVRGKQGTSFSHIRFFFDCVDDSEMPEQEWFISVKGQFQINPGPALLLLYCRDDVANVFGVVEMASGAWAHYELLQEMPLYQTSPVILGGLVKGGGALIAGGALVAGAPILLPLLAVPGVRKKIGQFTGTEKIRNATEGARHLMYRIAKNRMQYWPMEEETSGKL